ncbi:hypothetical protein K466DRAFT_161311 [Polyporus arcularius HHB13444]|uniref:Uncharacterized protein n=1 Tax=Polyporus arcularius HHB13444 TaxID=1314778 RepID=A0A5C3PU79_9APHY|nr:hypothetical protein K466DRAFT_161311 [Polyporus arcularius HHB13444]
MALEEHEGEKLVFVGRQHQSSLNRVSQEREAPYARAAKCTKGRDAHRSSWPTNESQTDEAAGCARSLRRIPKSASTPRRRGVSPGPEGGFTRVHRDKLGFFRPDPGADCISGATLGLFRPDPARVDREGLECSDLSPLTKMDARGVLCGVSLAALVLSSLQESRQKRQQFCSGRLEPRDRDRAAIGGLGHAIERCRVVSLSWSSSLSTSPPSPRPLPTLHETRPSSFDRLYSTANALRQRRRQPADCELRRWGRTGGGGRPGDDLRKANATLGG